MGAEALFVWEGHALQVSGRIDVTPHEHHAVQLSFALEGALHAQSEERSWSSPVAVLGPDQPHELGSDGPALTFYLEPTARNLSLVNSEVGALEPRAFQRMVELGRSLRRGGLSGVQIKRDAQAALERLLPPAQPIGTEPRIEKVKALLFESPESRLELEMLARAVHLSPSRLRHLFKAHTGTSIKRYRRWVRLLKALELIGRGASVLEAAHAAGFSDSAHLSRTCRRTFGRSPGQLPKHSRFFQAFHGGASHTL